MLTREQIEAALKGKHTSCKLSIREALETALALYDENERLKDNITGLMGCCIKPDQKVRELEAEIERLKREQLEWSREALEHAKELEAENEKLKGMVCHPIDFAHWKKELEAENYQLEQYRRWYDEETAPLRAENARLRERNEYLESTLDGYRSNAEYCEKYKAENARLREVVDAAQEFISSDYYCENRHAHRAVALEAALEKVEKPKENKEGRRVMDFEVHNAACRRHARLLRAMKSKKGGE